MKAILIPYSKVDISKINEELKNVSCILDKKSLEENVILFCEEYTETFPSAIHTKLKYIALYISFSLKPESLGELNDKLKNINNILEFISTSDGLVIICDEKI